MNRLKIFAAIVTFALFSFAANAQTVNEVNEKFNAAAELMNAKQYIQAIPVLNQVIEMGLEVGEDAMETVVQAQKLLPVCYFRAGLADAQANKYDSALENLTKATSLGELYGDAATTRNANSVISKLYGAMGAEAFNSKNYSKAAEIFAKGYEANPTDTDLALNLAMSYAEMGDTENAYRVYNEIIALQERNSQFKAPAEAAREKLAYYRMLDASKAIEAKNFAGAIEIIENILQSDPNNAVANMMLIQTATNQKNWDKVIERGEAAASAQTTPELRSDAYFLLGAAYQNKENKAKAIENYRKVTAGGNVSTAKAQIAELSK